MVDRKAELRKRFPTLAKLGTTAAVRTGERVCRTSRLCFWNGSNFLEKRDAAVGERLPTDHWPVQAK